MHIRRLACQGLRALPDFEAKGLERVVSVAGSPAGRTALADAIAIALSAFSEADTLAVARDLGLGDACEVTAEALPDSLLTPRPEVARALFTDDRTVRVRLDLELDPPQYGEIRTAAMRDPRLVSALAAQDTTLGLTAGWAWTRDWTVATISVLGVRLGDVELPLVGDDRPTWLDRFFAGLAGRLIRHRAGQVDARAFARAERSPSTERRAGARRVREILAGRAFGLGQLEVVEGPDGPWLGLPHGLDLLPLRAHGPRVEHAVGLAQAVHQSGAEILIAEAPLDLAERPRALSNWLRAQAEADGSALEQVFLLGGGGAGALRPG